MIRWGNERANAFFEARRPQDARAPTEACVLPPLNYIHFSGSLTISRRTIAAFIKQKYVNRAWVDTSPLSLSTSGRASPPPTLPPKTEGAGYTAPPLTSGIGIAA